MRECAPCAAEALAKLQLKRNTRAAAADFASSPEFRMRPEFRNRMQKQLVQPTRRPWMTARVQWASALIMALVLIVASTTVVLHRTERKHAIAELLDLHVATMASPNPVDVISTDRHTVKPWFQGKLPFTFNLPEFENSRYKLLGGKLIYFEHNPGAQLVLGLNKHQISVFIVQAQPPQFPSDAGPTSNTEQGFSVETWSHAGLRFFVIGDTSPADIHALGDLFRAAM